MGANVQLLVSNVSYVGFKDRALNHSEYCELLVRGDVIQSDASVSGLPDPIPQTVRLLFRPGRQLDMLVLPFGVIILSRSCLISDNGVVPLQDTQSWILCEALKIPVAPWDRDIRWQLVLP